MSERQQTQNVADGLRMAWGAYANGPASFSRSLANASVELACKRLAELEELRADAERYRKLVGSSPSGEIGYLGRTYRGKAELDAAIDATPSKEP